MSARGPCLGGGAFSAPGHADRRGPERAGVSDNAPCVREGAVEQDHVGRDLGQ